MRITLLGVRTCRNQQFAHRLFTCCRLLLQFGVLTHAFKLQSLHHWRVGTIDITRNHGHGHEMSTWQLALSRMHLTALSFVTLLSCNVSFLILASAISHLRKNRVTITMSWPYTSAIFRFPGLNAIEIHMFYCDNILFPLQQPNLAEKRRADKNGK